MLNSRLTRKHRVAAILASTLLLSACGSSQGEVAAPEPAPTPQPAPTPAPQPPMELSCQTVGVSVEELPARWNEFIDAVGFGFRLPETLEASGTVLGLNEYTQYLDGTESPLFAVDVFWDPDTGEVREVTIFGPVADERTSVALTGTAGAMIFATTSKSASEAEDFLVEALMAGVDSHEPGGFTSELVEEDGREFRFTLVGDGADWSVVGNLPCP